MARTRQIKPHFLHSVSMSKVSVGAQLTFIRLWLTVDDAGRAADPERPLHWPVTLFPCQPHVKDEVAGWLDELEGMGCIVRYRVNGKLYLRVVNWRKHQRICNPTPSRLPTEAQGIRETFGRISRNAPEAIARSGVEGPSSRDAKAVLSTSSRIPEAFARNPVEPAI